MNKELGVFLRRHRTERKISLRSLDIGAPSTVSRFEKGETSISLKRFYKILEAEGLWGDDIVTMESPFIALSYAVLQTKYKAGDLKKVLRLINVYRETVSNDSSPIITTSLQVLKCVEQQINTGTVKDLSVSSQNKLLKLLKNSKLWLEYDFYVVAIAAPYLSSTTLESIANEMHLMLKDMPTPYGKLLRLAVRRMCLCLVIKNERALARYIFSLFPDSDKKSSDPVLDEIVHILLIEDMNDGERIRMLKQYSNALGFIGMQQISDYVYALAERIDNGETGGLL